jgi:hypothetical protein
MERAGRCWRDPKTTREVASALQAVKPELTNKEADVAVRVSLGGMLARGMVVREGKAWGSGCNKCID